MADRRRRRDGADLGRAAASRAGQRRRASSRSSSRRGCWPRCCWRPSRPRAARALTAGDGARRAADQRDAAGDRRPGERLRAVLRLPRAVRVRRGRARDASRSSRSSPCSTARVLMALAADEPDAVVADALAGRWIVVVCGSVALGLFARHLGLLRRASEDRFRRGFADSPVGMAIISADWRWLEVNDALCRMLGRTRDELVGRSPAEVTHPDDIAPSRAVVDRALAGAGAAGVRQALPAPGRRGRVGGRRLDLRPGRAAARAGSTRTSRTSPRSARRRRRSRARRASRPRSPRSGASRSRSRTSRR